MPGFKFKKFSLSNQGAKKVLGKLEAQVMEYVWKNSHASVREVRDGISSTYKEVSFNAVMTIMNRLVSKGLLQKTKHSGQYVYEAKISQAEFSKIVAQDVILSVLKDPELFSTVSFVDITKSLDKATIKKLREIID